MWETYKWLNLSQFVKRSNPKQRIMPFVSFRVRLPRTPSNPCHFYSRGEKNQCFPTSPNTKDLLNEYVWKSRGQRVSCWDFFPLRESDTISLSARYFLSSHTQSSTCFFRNRPRYKTWPEDWGDFEAVHPHGDGCWMTMNVIGLPVIMWLTLMSQLLEKRFDENIGKMGSSCGLRIVWIL